MPKGSKKSIAAKPKAKTSRQTKKNPAAIAPPPESALLPAPSDPENAVEAGVDAIMQDDTPTASADFIPGSEPEEDDEEPDYGQDDGDAAWEDTPMDLDSAPGPSSKRRRASSSYTGPAQSGDAPPKKKPRGVDTAGRRVRVGDEQEYAKRHPVPRFEVRALTRLLIASESLTSPFRQRRVASRLHKSA